MISGTLQIAEYRIEIIINDDGVTVFKDNNTGKIYDMAYIVERDIRCDGIRYGQRVSNTFLRNFLSLTSVNGIMYEICLSTFHYKIEDIVQLRIKSIGETVNEYFGVKGDEESGRRLINLDFDNQHAYYDKYEVKGLHMLNHRRNTEWNGANFENAVLRMLQEINNDALSDISMRQMHEGKRENERLSRRI